MRKQNFYVIEHKLTVPCVIHLVELECNSSWLEMFFLRELSDSCPSNPSERLMR